MAALYYATGNKGKFEEVDRYLRSHAPHVNLQQYPCDLTEIQSLDQREIALLKAREAWKLLQKPLIIDDSGIYFEKYHEFPGTLSKYVFEGIGYEGILKLVGPGDRAYLRITLVYVSGDNVIEIFEADVKGAIVHPEVIEAPEGLPYCAFFQPDGADRTYTELRKIGKDHIYNYRIHALQKFLAWYDNSYKPIIPSKPICPTY